MCSKKRLLIIGPLPPPLSGPEIGTKTLLESEVLNDKYTVKILNTSVRKSNADKGKMDAVIVYALIRYIWLLFFNLATFRPHYTLYTPTSATLKGWVRDGLTLFTCWVFRRKLVIQFRCGHFRHFYNSIKPWQQKIIHFLLNRSSKILVQADVLRKQVAGLVPDEKIDKLYNSVVAEFFDPFEGFDRKLHETVNVLFIGHLSQAKGYCDVLSVIPDIVKDHHNVRFQFIGTLKKVERNVFFNQATGEPIQPVDPEQQFESSIKNNGLEDYAQFLGNSVYDEEKINAFKNADIFILPSYSEGFSMSILEGMSAGLPVIATKVGAAPEIIDGNTGFIIMPGDNEALKEKLITLISDSNKRITIGTAAREKCREQFLVQAQSNSLVSILENLAG